MKRSFLRLASTFVALVLFPSTMSSRAQVPSVVEDDITSESPLEQPNDPTNGDLLPEDDGMPVPSVEGETPPATESSDGVIKFDPSKAVVKPAKVKPKEPVKPKAVPPPPVHSANPEADLFEHAQLVAKYELWPQAERQYRLYVETYPNRPNSQAAYYGLAEARLKLGKMAESEATYRALLSKFKRGEHVGAAAYRLANMHYRREEYDKAVGYFETASNTATKDLVRKSASFFRARCLQQLGSVRRSEDLYRKLASSPEEHPYRDASSIILARMDVDRGRTEEAFQTFVKLSEPPLALNIRAEAVTKAGLMAAKLGMVEEAQKYYEEILEVDTADARPWHPKAFWGLLHLFYEQGKYQELIDQYQSRRISYNETAGDQGQAPVLLMVAHAFRRLEKYRQAASLYDQAVRLNPEGKESVEAGYRHLYCLYKDQSPFLDAKTEEYLKKHVRGKKAPMDPLTNRVSKKKLKSSGKGKENGENGGGMGDLQALILAKNKSRAGAADDLFARLEEKYGGGGKKKEKSTPTKVKSGKVSKKK